MVFSAIAFAMCVGCNHPFSVEAQYGRQVSGVWGETPQCWHGHGDPQEGLKVAKVELVDYFRYEKALCRAVISKEGDEFILSSMFETCVERSDLMRTPIAAFTVRVKKIGKDKIKLIKDNGAPEILVRCSAQAI